MTTLIRSWRTFCNDYGPESLTQYRHFGDRRTVRFTGGTAPIIEVDLIEDVDGELMGWEAAGAEGLRMVQHHRIFNMQFPAGYLASEAAGDGRAVRLRLAFVPPRTWLTHCLDYGPNIVPAESRYREFGDPRFVRMFGSQPIVQVRLIEDANGVLKGWVETGQDQIDMVEHHTVFEVSFAEGSQAQEAAGQGRAYRVRLEVVS
jgi:hypothetical protein